MLSMLLHSTFVALCLGSIAACSNAVSNSATKLVGTEDSPEKPYRHTIYIPTLNCTATLQTPSRIVLAAHCVNSIAGQSMMGQINSMILTLFALSDDGAEQRVYQATLKGVHIHPSWDTNLRSTGDATKAAYMDDTVDVAVLSLDQDIPLGLSEFATKMQVKNLKAVMTVGGGCTRWGAKSDYKLRAAAIPIIETLKTKYAVGIEALSGETVSLCPGDSGGPSFAIDAKGVPLLSTSGVPLQVGVSSVAFPLKAGDTIATQLPTYITRLDTEAVQVWLADGLKTWTLQTQSSKSLGSKGIAENLATKDLVQLITETRKKSGPRISDSINELLYIGKMFENFNSEQKTTLARALANPGNSGKKTATIIKAQKLLLGVDG